MDNITYAFFSELNLDFTESNIGICGMFHKESGLVISHYLNLFLNLVMLIGHKLVSN